MDNRKLRFNPDGSYMVKTKDQRIAAAQAMFRHITTIPQAYHDKGPEYCRDAMELAAREALSLIGG